MHIWLYELCFSEKHIVSKFELHCIVHPQLATTACQFQEFKKD